MSSPPSGQMLSWAAEAVGAGARVVAVESLHDGYSPWLLRIERGETAREVVLRAAVAGRIFPFQIATGAAALRAAEQHGLTAARLIASDRDGRAAGAPATLETVVPGSTASPAVVSAGRLRAAGAAIAKAHKVFLEPSADLPLRVRSLQGPAQLDEWALERRWATLYRATPDSEKHAVIEALCQLTAWSTQHARQVMANTRTTPLLQRADDTVRAITRPPARTVFVHADLWTGNMVWNGDDSVTLIDWKDSGVGEPGVDLGHLRMTMALKYGLDAATHVLDGWQHEMGREFTDVPYWDLVAAVHTPTDLDVWEPGFDKEGHRIDSRAPTGRRDAFLRNALDQLDPETAQLHHLDVSSP